MPRPHKRFDTARNCSPSGIEPRPITHKSDSLTRDICATDRLSINYAIHACNVANIIGVLPKVGSGDLNFIVLHCHILSPLHRIKSIRVIAARDWSRTSESDLCAIGLGSIPDAEQLRAVSKRFCGFDIKGR